MFRWCLGHVLGVHYRLCFGGVSVMFGCCFAHAWVVFWPVSVSRLCLGRVSAMFGKCLAHVWVACSLFFDGVSVLFFFWLAVVR